MEQTGNRNMTKITDLNFDCLESCLKHLNIDELLYVAQCNKQLRRIARHLIARAFKGQVLIRPNDLFWLKDDNNLYMGTASKFSLQFLRCCGDLISGLNIKTERSFFFETPTSVESDLIVEHINEYCSEFLTRITFDHCTESSLKGLTTPFKKVEILEITESFPTDTKLSELFPNLREFRLYYGPYKLPTLSNDFFANHYPLLEHVAIEVHPVKAHYENIAILLRSNPRLKSLTGNLLLEAIFDTTVFSNEHLQNVEKIHLSDIRFKPNMYEKRIHLKNLKELVLQINPSFVCNNKPWAIPFTSDKLESLVIIEHSVIETDILRLVANYPKVKKLKVESSSDINYLKIWKVLPLLEIIDFAYWNYFTVEEAVRFVQDFHSLKLFRFTSRPEISIKKLMTDLGNAWLVSFRIYETETLTKKLLIELKRCTC